MKKSKILLLVVVFLLGLLACAKNDRAVSKYKVVNNTDFPILINYEYEGGKGDTKHHEITSIVIPPNTERQVKTGCLKGGHQ